MKPQDELAGLLPPPPPEQQLPRHALHKAELLAAIGAEPARLPGLRRRTPRLRPPRRWPAASGWLVPIFAAGAVTAVVAAALTLSLTLFGQHASPQPTSGHHAPPGPLPSGKLSRTRHWQLPSSGLRGVVVRANIGSIHVNGDSSGSRIAITAWPVYRRGVAPVISSKVTHGQLTVVASCPSRGKSRPCAVVVTVTLPRSFSVQASAEVGSIAVNDMTGNVVATDNVGDFNGYHLDSKSVTVDTRVGAIDVAFSAPPDRVDTTDQTGSIAITVPPTVSYRVNASTHVGISGVNVTVPRSKSAAHVIRASTQVGSVSVTG